MPTDIEWTHMPGYKGETWNPVTGCVKISPGCANCYAETILMRFHRSGPFLPGNQIELHHERMDIPSHWKQPRMIFVNSVSDTFHEDVFDQFIFNIFRTVIDCPQHLFLFLTKRPDRMLQWFRGGWYEQIEKFAHMNGLGVPLDNVWLGTSTENQHWANIRIPELLECPAVVHYVSCEPLLGPINLSRLNQSSGDVIDGLYGINDDFLFPPMGLTKGLDQVIVGGESGNSKKIRPMHPQWARDLRDQTKNYSKAFFFKQWGKYRPLTDEELVDRNKDYPWKTHPVSLDPHEREIRRKLEETDAWMIKGSKGGNGNLLDGRTWQEFPDTGNERRAS